MKTLKKLFRLYIRYLTYPVSNRRSPYRYPYFP